MESDPKPTPVKEGISSSLSIDTLDDIARAAKMIYQSGAFSGLANSQEAGAKIMAGLELGLSPMTAIRNIYFFDGEVTLSGPIIAALIRKHPDYDYRILGSNTEGAKVRFFRREMTEEGEKMVPQEPDVAFTKAMAQRAGLLSKQNWKQFPEDMYVWRCIARGSRWHCPEVGKGTLYLPDEIESGAVEHEEAEQIRAEDTGEPEVEGEPKQVPESTTTEDTPDFEEEPKSAEPESSELSDVEKTQAKDPQVKPLDQNGETDDSAEKRAPAKPTAEATAPGNAGTAPGTETTTKESGKPESTKESGSGEKSDDSPPSEQMEDPAKRLEAMIPSYVTVNAMAVTREAAQKAKAMQTKLRSMDPGNRLLTQIKEYRDEVRENYPNEEDTDRKALDQVLDHHISRIGGSESPPDGGESGSDPVPEHATSGGGHPAEPPEDSGGQAEDSGGQPENTPESPDNHPKNAEPRAEEVSVPGMPWFDRIGATFRADMEKTRHILQEAAGKKGISPLEARLEEVRTKFNGANPTEEHLRAFEGAISPYAAILEMRKALLDGDPDEDAANEALSDLFEFTEEYSNPKRRVLDREIAVRETRRLRDKFDSVKLETVEEGPPKFRLETEGQGQTAVPDMPLPPGFPKRETLQEAGVTRTGEVAERLRDGVLTGVSGIGEAFAERIADYLREITDDGKQDELPF